MNNEEKLEWLWDKFKNFKSFSKDKADRELEKKLIAYFDDDSIWERFQGYLDIMLEDTAPGKVKKLHIVMKSFLTLKNIKFDLDDTQTAEPAVKEVRPGFYVGTTPSSVFSYLPPPSEELIRAEKAFEALWPIWPKGGYPESKQLAKEMFLEVSRDMSLEEVFLGCKSYADNFNASFTSDIYAKSLRGFLEEKVKHLLPWIERARELENKDIDVTDAREYFDAAWSWYPKFGRTFSDRAMQENFSLYKKYISKEKAPDFFCAVQHYFSDCYYAIHQEDQDPKFIKSFQSFMSEWDMDNPYEQMGELILCPFMKAIEKREISRHQGIMMIWATEGIRNIVLYNSKGKNKTVTKAIEGSVDTAYRGFGNIEPDLTAIEEIRKEVWERAKEKKPDWTNRSDQ